MRSSFPHQTLPRVHMDLHEARGLEERASALEMFLGPDEIPTVEAIFKLHRMRHGKTDGIAMALRGRQQLLVQRGGGDQVTPHFRKPRFHP